MKTIAYKRLLSIILMLAMLLSFLPAMEVAALEDMTKLIAWEYNDTTPMASEVSATTGSGLLSLSTGEAFQANSTGYFHSDNWSTEKYWLLSGLDTSGRSNLRLAMRTSGSAIGPANWVVEYSLDAGDTWAQAGTYDLHSTDTQTSAFTPVVRLPEACVSENLLLRLRPMNMDAVASTEDAPVNVGTKGTNKISFITISSMEAGYGTLAAFHFTEANHPESFPTEANEGWGYLNTTASGKVSFTKTDKVQGMNVTKWGEGHNWCMTFNASACSDLTLEADLRSSSKGPADFAVEYSNDGGESWVWVQNFQLPNSTTKLHHQTIHLPDAAACNNLLVRFRVDSGTSIDGSNINKTTSTCRINNVTLTGYIGDLHELDPETPTWPMGYGDVSGDAIPSEAFVGWNFEESKGLPASAVKGWGVLANSITTGPSYTGGALTVKGWAKDAYWLVVTNTTGYTDMKLNVKLASSSTGPRDVELQYSVDKGAAWTTLQAITLTTALQNYEIALPDAAQSANLLLRFVVVSDKAVKDTSSAPAAISSGGNSKINMCYLTGKLTGTHQADPVSVTYPPDYNPKQEAAVEGEGFDNANVSGSLIAGWEFTEPAELPAAPVENGWGSMTHTTAAYVSYTSKALGLTGWTTGTYWQFVANTSGCTDMTFQMKTGSSGTGPKNFSLRYSVDLGETWVEFCNLSISGTVKKYIVALPDAAQSDNLIIRVAVADDESIKGDVIKNGGSNKINNIAIFGIQSGERLPNPEKIQYPADWSMPRGYIWEEVFVPENDPPANVTGFTFNEDDRRSIASWGGNANYAADLIIYGDLITANDRLDGSASLTVNVGGEDITPGFTSSSTNSTNYYLGSKSPCLGSGTTTVDENNDGKPDVDADGQVITKSTDDYLQMKVSTAKYTDLDLSFRLRVSAAGPKGFTVKYSKDGETWTNFGTGHYSYAYTGYGYGGATYDVEGEGEISNGYIPMEVAASYQTVSLDVPKGCEDVQTLYIRLYADKERHTPTVDKDGNPVTTVSKISSVRIDTIDLSGCPMIHSAVTDWVRCDLPTSVPAGQSLILTCPTQNVTIYYSFDSGETVEVYDSANPPELTELPANVKTWAEAPNHAGSVKTMYHFVQAQVHPVKASPNGGAVVAGTEVKFICSTEGATIRYSLDKGLTWQDYSSDEKPVLTADMLQDECEIFVMGVKEGYLNSPITVLTYTLRVNEKYNIYFGQLHSHTNYSDGSGSCEEAFQHASNVENLDFLAVTDHSNAFDNDMQASIHDGSMSSKWVSGHDLADKYTTKDFVGMYGYEMTWSNGLGHMNTYNTAGFQSRTQTEFASYSTALNNYYTALKSDSNSISQFNHPGTTFGNFQDYAYYDEVIDELITLLEVGNGEGTVGSSGYFPSYSEYTRALDLGWHIAPTNNQDNHKGNWGDANTARSVVLADSLTRNNIYDAMRNRRVYATEDNDFNIYYTLNNYEMGTILTGDDVEETVHLKAEISDPTDSGNVKVEVIVNGGIIAATKSVSVTSSTVEFDLGANYSYYYLRLTQADGNIAVTAPVWIGEVEAIGIKDMSSDADISVQGEKNNITLNLYNDEDADLKVSSIEFSVNGEVVHTVDLQKAGLTSLLAHTTDSYVFPFVYDGIGTMTLNVTLKGIYEGVEKQYNGVLQMKYLPASVISNVIIDGTHYNDYVTGYYSGNMTQIVKLGVDNFARITVVQDKITASMLDDCQLLIITSPAKRTLSGYRTSHFEQEFITMVANYMAKGGSVVLCGAADFNDSTVCQTHTEMNKLLSAMGATVTLRSDEIAEQRENGTLNYGPELYNYDAASKWFVGAPEGLSFSVYAACTVDLSKNAENTKVYKAQTLVSGNANTFSIDAKTKGGVTINEEELQYVQQAGQVVHTVVQDTKAGGHIFLTGSPFMSDYEMDTDENEVKLNTVLMQNILEGTGAQLSVTPIADMRKGKLGEVFCIEGWVTNGTDNDKTKFFDTIYLQDETGGVTVYPYSEAGLKRGTKLQIIGYVDAYQDDIEIQILKCKVLDDKNLNLIAPTQLSCADAMDYATYGGSLVQTQGVIVDIALQGDTVTQLRLRDDSGKLATVFIDGYIYSGTTGENKLADFCKLGYTVSAVGMCFMHPETGTDVSSCCLRVRDCDEIVLISDECGHLLEAGEVVAPTCTEDGYTTYICTACGKTVVGDIVPATGHQFEDGVCIVCGEEDPDYDPTCAHEDTRTERQEPTCTADGLEKLICEDCGGVISTTVLSALGHNWDSGKVTRPATATEEGLRLFTCTVCGAAREEPIPPLGGKCDGGEDCVSREFEDLDPNMWYHEGTDYAISTGLMNGVGDGKFDPDGSLTRAMLVTILYRREGKPSISGLNNPFLDVPKGDWYTDAVIWAADKGIVTGTSPTTFEPDAFITREQIAAILFRYSDSPDGRANISRYPDAKLVSDWALNAIRWANYEGIINGSNENGVDYLNPLGNATRAECATMLFRFFTK